MLDFLEALKRFLADRPEYAFLACCIVTIMVLWRTLRREQREKFELAMKVLPLADKLQHMLQKAAERRALRPSSQSTPPSS